MRPALPLLPLLLLGWLLAGCATESIGPEVPIRSGGDPDQRVFDATPPDAAPHDAAPPPPPDAALPTTASPYTIWFVQRHDAPSAGLRAALDPPQVPAPFPDPAAPVLVEWAGPESPGAAVLLRRLAAGLPTAPLYVMADRAAEAASDVSWLVARALDHPAALTHADRPVLAVAPAPGRDGLNPLRTRLAALPVEPFLVMELDVTDRPWPAADAVIALARTGVAPDPVAQHVERLEAGRAAALSAGWTWIPRAGPPPNPRLIDPAGPVAATPGDDLVRSLVLSRQAVTPGAPIVLLDALGGWSDDRQLDPVEGETTTAPDALTDGAPQVAYGQGRLLAVADHLSMVRASPPPRLTQRPILLRSGGPTLPIWTHADGEITVETVSGPCSWLIDGRPFELPADARLRYHRSGPLRVELLFADGPALHARLPAPTGLQIDLDLSAFAGEVVTAITVVTDAPGTLGGISLSD